MATDAEIRAWMTANGRGHKAAAEHFGITVDEARAAYRRQGSTTSAKAAEASRAREETAPPTEQKRGPGRPRRKQSVTIQLPDEFDPLEDDPVTYWETMLEYYTAVMQEAVDAGNYRDGGVIMVQVGKARKALDEARAQIDAMDALPADELVEVIAESIATMTPEQRAKVAAALAKAEAPA